MILLDFRMMPIAAIAPLLAKVIEILDKIRTGTELTRTVVATLAAVSWALARILLEAWWQLAEIALVLGPSDHAS